MASVRNPALRAVSRYVPAKAFGNLFGEGQGFGVLMAATIGVPLYACGGGTIPLLMQWLASGIRHAFFTGDRAACKFSYAKHQINLPLGIT